MFFFSERHKLWRLKEGQQYRQFNRPCSKNNKVSCLSTCCLSLWDSHATSINQVSALSLGSKSGFNDRWSLTGQEEDGKEADMKEGSWGCGTRVKWKAIQLFFKREDLQRFVSSLLPSPILTSYDCSYSSSTAHSSLNTRDVEKKSAKPAVPWSLL